MNDKVVAFKKARVEFIDLVKQFPKDKTEEKLFDSWSLKDILFHISRWDEALVGNLVDLKVGKEPPFYGSVQSFNDESSKLGKDLSWDEVYKRFIKSGEKLEKEWENLPDNLWEKKFWSTKNSTPTKFLKINTHHYLEEHLPQLKSILRSLK